MLIFLCIGCAKAGQCWQPQRYSSVVANLRIRNSTTHVGFCCHHGIATSRGSRDECLGTIENHGNTEITETVIFLKYRDFAKMPCFAVFLTKMPRFYVFYLNFSFLVSISWSLLWDFNTENIYFCYCYHLRMLCYLLA